MQFRQLIEDWMEESNESKQEGKQDGKEDYKPQIKITMSELNTLKDLVS
jgi:hypothetical protein